ncbi:MAG: endonuclease domain-containing protein [Hyphomicrobiales bacterium]
MPEFATRHSVEMAYVVPGRLARARILRKTDTAAEQRLWESLRGRRLNGWKFVRQLSVGMYVADFVCRERRLIVEVDGATHSTDAEVEYDGERTAFLEGKGYRVLRFWNEDVFKGLNDVLDRILAELENVS